MSVTECRAELLIGRRVVDAEGERVGRIEEIVAEYVDDEYVVREFHVGAFAVFERLANGMLSRGLLRLIGGQHVYDGFVVPWQQMDLSDPDHPRVTVAKADLRRIDDETREPPPPSPRRSAQPRPKRSSRRRRSA
jgi:sporulation protein YlmC with PRC-barrel domain